MWNWQQPDWPDFKYKSGDIEEQENKLLVASGRLYGAFSHLNEKEQNELKVKIMSEEALKTSEIEGEYLERDSVQSSVRRNLGLQTDNRRVNPKERGIAELMIDLYKSYDAPLSHQQLYKWHKFVMNGRVDLEEVGSYRTLEEPMQVISGPFGSPNIHLEAPPSFRVMSEMERFIEWFNKKQELKPIARAAIAHLYFESIHPFEDGNGRIGRAISEKSLSQDLGFPALISLATIINSKKKSYYQALEKANKSNEVTEWLIYFAKTINTAIEFSNDSVEFIIKKVKLFDEFRGKLNQRQEKCITRMFEIGHTGFKGGLSADNYISITKATRPTATRDLSDLAKKGVFIKKGELKSTRYYLNI